MHVTPEVHLETANVMDASLFATALMVLYTQKNCGILVACIIITDCSCRNIYGFRCMFGHVQTLLTDFGCLNFITEEK